MTRHVTTDPAIPPRSLRHKGDVMKTLGYAALVLAVIAAGSAPVMSQILQPDAPYNSYGQPNQVYGMPGAGQASASSHPAP
jgi:hypothetical protein